MNVIQILLSFLAALLLAAIVLSYSDMRNGEAEEGRIRTASQVMDENNRLQAELDRLRSGVVAAKVPAVAEPAEMSEEKLAEIEKQNELLKQQLILEEEKRKQAEAESVALAEAEPEKSKKEIQKAKLISIATVMAYVKEVAAQGDISFIVLDVMMPQQVQLNKELAIRRGDEIIGKLVVTNIADGHVFADPLPSSFAGREVDVVVGDELIIVPN